MFKSRIGQSLTVILFLNLKFQFFDKCFCYVDVYLFVYLYLELSEVFCFAWKSLKRGIILEFLNIYVFALLFVSCATTFRAIISKATI